MKRIKGISFNSPTVLTFTAISFVMLVADLVARGAVGGFLAVRFSSWLDPLMYLRMFTHIFAHASIEHFTSNFMMILVVGPLAEEKYGSSRLAVMIIITAVVTGLINILLFKNIILLGASGIAFMLILLASATNIRDGYIPLTLILVAVFYIGNEFLSQIFIADNISRISHILGGLCGAIFGFVSKPKRR